jgi:hypothetical protein
MKKTIIFLGVLVVLLITIPFLIKDQLIGKQLIKVHQEEGVLVSYESSSLSLFSFPSISLELTNVVVQNELFTANTQVAKCEKIKMVISLSELFNQAPAIELLSVSKGIVDLEINEKGEKNFEFLTRKGPKRKTELRIEHFIADSVDVSFLDEVNQLDVRTVVESVDWKEIDCISLTAKVLVKELSKNNKTYFTNKKIKLAGLCDRSKGKVIPRATDVAIDGLRFSIEPKGSKGWRVFSDVSKIEDYFELLPDFIRPKVEAFSSNTPLVFDLFLKRGKIKSVLVEAKHIELKNERLGKQIDEINFVYEYKKRDGKLSYLNLQGLGSSLSGFCSTKNFKENEIELGLEGKLDVKNIIEFFYSEQLKGEGELVIVSDISKRKKLLSADVAFHKMSISDSKDKMIYQMDGEVHLNEEKLVFDNFVFNPSEENLSLSGTIYEPINFLLLNKKPVKGELSVGCKTVKFAKQQFEQVKIQFDFAFVPSTEFLYIVGLPVNPFVSPTYLNITSCDFIQTNYNQQPVHLALSYQTEDIMHLQELTCQVGDSLFRMELVSSKPNNLALFAFEKQEFWVNCKYQKFSLSNVLKRIGLQIEASELLSGEFETIVGYQPTKLFSGKGMTIDFNDMNVDLSVNNIPIIASGNAVYENEKLNLKSVTMSEGKLDLLETFLLSFF